MLTTLTHLAQCGLAVPRDISVVVAEDEPYFRHIVPEVTTYASAPGAFAHRIGRFLKKATDGTLTGGMTAQIMPDFIPGASVIPFRPNN